MRCTYLVDLQIFFYLVSFIFYFYPNVVLAERKSFEIEYFERKHSKSVLVFSKTYKKDDGFRRTLEAFKSYCSECRRAIIVRNILFNCYRFRFN